jgi:hypothetical protein
VKRYRQVTLTRPSEIGFYTDVCWIDADLAIKGNRVRDERGLIWCIYETYGTMDHDGLQFIREEWRQFETVLDGN